MLSGERPVKAQCLPFSQIPHTTRLFTDFLSGSPQLQPFFPRGPQFSEWLKDEASKLQYDADRRKKVAAILERQNKNWGASSQTLENIARFQAGAAAVVTGQQVGLFGGPLFSLFKALTAVKLADETTKAGVDCVPVFWLATQDHDLDEIQTVSFPSAEAVLQELVVPSHGIPDAPVGSISLGPEIEAVVEAAAQLLGNSEATTLLRETYRPDATFGSAFANLFARLFAEWGVILLDAADPELNSIATPIYRAAVERAAELEAALLTRNQELGTAGYHQQVKVTPDSTLLFTLQNGARIPIHRRVTASHETEFLIGEEKIAPAELLRRIASTPQQFSANVLLRPVVQDYLLPTLAYTGGSAEVAYFAQAAVVFQALLGRVTPIIPRFSATIIEIKANVLLERYSLNLPDLFNTPEKIRERLAAQALPQELQSAFDDAGNSLSKSFSAIRESLSKLDKTLVDAASNAESKIRHQLESLQAKAARAELQQSEILDRHAQKLSNALYPNKTLQEREVAGIYFLARYGKEFLKDVYATIHSDCFDHQILTL
jgi:bacillithiol biosynthesis cysteine-adding enzyme BshC